MAEVRALERDGRPDVVYAHGFRSAAVALPLLAHGARPGLVLEVHSLATGGSSSSRLRLLRNRVAEFLPRLARAEVIALSQAEADALVEQRVAPRQQVHVAYPPVPIEEYARPARAVRVDAAVVTYVGNFQHYQGVDMLLEAIPVVAAAHSGVRFVLVGGHDDENVAAAASLGRDVLHRVEFVGRVAPARVAEIYEGADVLVIPRPDLPINRTTARKLGEYLASGRLVVATDVGDHQRLIAENDAGIVGAPTASGIADGLIRALDGATDSGQLIANASRVAHELFAVDSAIGEREAVLRQAAGSR
jgi:glycosyltransferase involved in cell wall biosynthesis